ncbi:MAG: hypothetical protein JSU07_13205 [Bacteroidetes bacterium]|nr:hypothetical protein [Bacteroidota bacterium]
MLISCLISTAQSFDKKNLVVDLSFGLEAYAVSYNYKLHYNNSTIKDTTTKSGAVNRFGALGIEYGIHKRFGAGIRLKSNRYFTSKDANTGATPDASSFEANVQLNYHPLIFNHFDLVIGSDIGYSYLNYNTNDVMNNKIYGGGSYFNLYLNPRFVFKNFGLNARIFFPTVNYINLTSNNQTFNNYVIAAWKGTGFGMSIGLQYRFSL